MPDNNVTVDQKAQKVVRIARTKLDRDAESHEKTLEISFENCTKDQILEMASRTVTIDWQRKVREAQALPVENPVKIDAAAHAERTVLKGAARVAAGLNRLSREDQIATLVDAMGMTEEEATELVDRKK